MEGSMQDEFNEEAQDVTTEDLHSGEKDSAGSIYIQTTGTYVGGSGDWSPSSRARPTIGRQVMAGSDGARMGLLEKAVVRQAIDLVAYEGIAEDALEQENSIHEQLILIAQERDQANARLAAKHEEATKINRIAKERGDEIATLLQRVQDLTEQLEMVQPEQPEDPEPAPEDPDEVVPVEISVPEAQAVVDNTITAREGERELQLAQNYESDHRLVIVDLQGRILLLRTDRVTISTQDNYDAEEGGAMESVWRFMQGMELGTHKPIVLRVEPAGVDAGPKDPFPTGLNVTGTIARYASGGWALKGDWLRFVTAVPFKSIASTTGGIVTMAWKPIDLNKENI